MKINKLIIISALLFSFNGWAETYSCFGDDDVLIVLERDGKIFKGSYPREKSMKDQISEYSYKENDMVIVMHWTQPLKTGLANVASNTIIINKYRNEEPDSWEDGEFVQGFTTTHGLAPSGGKRKGMCSVLH